MINLTSGHPLDPIGSPVHRAFFVIDSNLYHHKFCNDERGNVIDILTLSLWISTLFPDLFQTYITPIVRPTNNSRAP